jgi:hypothetical protein
MQPRRVYCRWVASERGCPRAAANKEDHLIAATAFGRHTASCFLFRSAASIANGTKVSTGHSNIHHFTDISTLTGK